MSEPITAGKFLSGIVQPKTGLKALAFLPWILLFVFLGYTIWRAYKKPEPTTTQNAERIINYTYTLEPRQGFFGCANYRIIRPERVEMKQPEVKK